MNKWGYPSKNMKKIELTEQEIDIVLFELRLAMENEMMDNTTQQLLLKVISKLEEDNG